MRELYPPLKPNERYELAVDDRHTLYVEESGNLDGIPVLVVHGGPGGGSDASMRRYFDPEQYRIILFDQRGCGKSTPHADLTDNTTDHLISDMENIREFFGIKKWMLFGGSWGSTLSLLYAQAHPDRVMGLVLRGIFLCRKSELQWFYQDGSHQIFPDYWQDFISIIPEDEQDNIMQAYYKRLRGDDDLVRMAAAKAWAKFECRCATLEPNHKIVEHSEDPCFASAIARIECHYFVNNSFIKENQILDNMDKIQHIPGIIVHGRYDMVCPLDNAWQLNKRWPNSTLQIIRNAGHSAMEHGIIDALVRATHDMTKMLSE